MFCRAAYGLHVYQTILMVIFPLCTEIVFLMFIFLFRSVWESYLVYTVKTFFNMGQPNYGLQNNATAWPKYVVRGDWNLIFQQVWRFCFKASSFFIVNKNLKQNIQTCKSLNDLKFVVGTINWIQLKYMYISCKPWMFK